MSKTRWWSVFGGVVHDDADPAFEVTLTYRNGRPQPGLKALRYVPKNSHLSVDFRSVPKELLSKCPDFQDVIDAKLAGKFLKPSEYRSNVSIARYDDPLFSVWEQFESAAKFERFWASEKANWRKEGEYEQDNRTIQRWRCANSGHGCGCLLLIAQECESQLVTIHMDANGHKQGCTMQSGLTRESNAVAADVGYGVRDGDEGNFTLLPDEACVLRQRRQVADTVRNEDSGESLPYTTLVKLAKQFGAFGRRMEDAEAENWLRSRCSESLRNLLYCLNVLAMLSVVTHLFVSTVKILDASGISLGVTGCAVILGIEVSVAILRELYAGDTPIIFFKASALVNLLLFGILLYRWSESSAERLDMNAFGLIATLWIWTGTVVALEYYMRRYVKEQREAVDRIIHRNEQRKRFENLLGGT